MASIKQKITPFLWFDREAEEAANFYASIFKNSSIDLKSYYSDGMPLPEIFLADKLHMNAKGYAIWQKKIRPYLLKD